MTTIDNDQTTTTRRRKRPQTATGAPTTGNAARIGLSSGTAASATESAGGPVGGDIDGLQVSATDREVELTAAYTRDLTADSFNVTVIATRDQVDERAADLQAKLAGLGITDLSEEGALVLSGLTAITPGVRRGVSMTHSSTIDTADHIGFDDVPEYFSYTIAGRTSALSMAATTLGTVTTTIPTDRSPASVRTSRGRTSRALAATASGTVGATTGGIVGAAATPSLNVGRTLVMTPTAVLDVDEAIIAVDELQLQDGMELLIANNVKYLTILANRITVGDGATITWESFVPSDHAPSSDQPVDGTSHARTSPCDHSWFHGYDGESGEDGRPGDQGYFGEDAPTVEIWTIDAVALPTFELKGGPGGTGQHGGPGGNGGHGAMGTSSWGKYGICQETVGWGGDGGDGGRGGKGGRGGRGGQGGKVVLYLTDSVHEAVLASGLTLNLVGGQGGHGGVGGAGGQRGLGGEPGDPHSLWCSAKPERAGSHGDDGDDGDDGLDGRIGPLYSDGEVPNLTAIVITEDEFQTKWNAPRIVTVTPFVAEVGDVVTLAGANYTSTATVSIGGTDVATTFISDTTLRAEVPPLSSGWHDVLVEILGGETSNPASLEVLPSLFAASPSPAWLGAQVTFTGSGFDPDCRVLFQGLELPPDSVSSDGTQVLATLPKPPGPFEDFGGTESVFVRNPDDVSTPSIDLPLRHVLSTGFDVPTNGYSFLNALQSITGVATLDTFAETYGLVDATLESLLHPGLTRAYFIFYLAYFNEVKAGYSSAFAMTAIDAYWTGTADLAGEHSSMADVEELLTVAQGHILSREVLEALGVQSAGGIARAEVSLNEIEDVFREQVRLPNDTLRHPIAPVMQLMPAGLPVTPAYFTDLSNSHGLLPIRIEYPEPGEPWEKRLVVYDNASDTGVGTESHIDFTRNGGTLDFVISHVHPVFGPLPDSTVKDSSNGWTLSHLSLDYCWLNNISMPLSGVWVFSRVALLIEDDRGRRYGTTGRQAWGDIPGVVAGVGVRNLYLLPLDQDLTFTITGTDVGDDETYTLVAMAGPLGRSVTLRDVPVKPTTRDTVRVLDGLREVAIVSNDAAKAIAVEYTLGGVDEVRALVLDGARVGRRGGLTLRATDDLSSFDVEGGQPEHPVAVELVATGPDGEQRERFEFVPIGGGRSRGFSVDGWERLDQTSLQTGSPSV